MRRFWRGKRVFVTGHTGFKGGWLVAWLDRLGARVKGYALKPDTEPDLFGALGLAGRCRHVVGDILDKDRLRRELRSFAPQVVFHLAAQPLVRRSYDEPVRTFAANVLGTVHVLEACRDLRGLQSLVCVTTDKCYRDLGARPCREGDALGGTDPYSASKACAELAIASYRDSFGLPVASARAGNVIGGGDWSPDRLIADAVRAFSRGRPAAIYSPEALRPWQHVLEPVRGYLMLAQACAGRDRRSHRPVNFGPAGSRKVGSVMDEFARRWPGARWEIKKRGGTKPEAARLTLDSNLAATLLGWRPRLELEKALSWTARWYLEFYEGREMWDRTQRQIEDYSSL